MAFFEKISRDFIRQVAPKVFYALLFVGLVGIAYSFYKSKKEAERKFSELIGTKEAYEQLTDYVAKLEVQYKNQKDLFEKSKKDWEKIIKEKDERIKVMSEAVFLVKRNTITKVGPDYKTQEYALYEVNIAGKDSPPVGYVLLKNDGKVEKGNYEFQILVKTLQTQDEKTGRIKVYSKAFLVLKENGLAETVKELKKWKDVEYPLNIVDGTAEVDPTFPNDIYYKKFFLWAPHINGGFEAGIGKKDTFARPMIGVSMSGYGKTKNDLDWKFFQIGTGYVQDNKTLDINFMPFSYRLLPDILSNTYVGPGIGKDSYGTTYFLGISITF